MRLREKDRKELLNISRETITQSLNNINYTPVSNSKVLQAHCGAFVTLHKEGKLRGCIGKFNVDYPLYQVIRNVSLLSAFDDDRFAPIQLDEMKDIDIEISVLTPFRKIRDIEEIEIGKHGILMVKQNRIGVFLPQVAVENDWSLIEFLGHCAQDKMGGGWNDWQSAEIYVFEAEVFSEKEFI